MKKTVFEGDFIRAFDEYNRSENFSVAGRRALFDYLEGFEEGTGEELEMDVIGFCCEFTEYATALEAAQACGYEEVVDLEPHGSVDLLEVDKLEQEQALKWLNDRTNPIEFEGGVIIQNF